MNYFQKTCSRLIKTLLPQSCALCRQSSGGDAPLCAACRQRLPGLPPQHCPQCADFSAAGVICGRCQSDSPAFDGVICPWLYAEPVDQLVQALKYRHQLHLATWFGQQLLATLAARTPALGSIDAILPLPLHPARMKTRGFNQSLEFARPIARGLDKPLLRFAASRVRDTAPQAGLPRDERQRNMQGAFECHTDLSGQTILVVDDVLTTGSSAHELARILKIHGAREVWVGAAARTQHETT
jgi:ComF family protein